MFNKRALFILFIFVMIITTISAVSANDSNMTSEIIGEVSSPNEVILENSNETIIKESPKTFIDLEKDINGNENAEIYLNHNYTFNPESDSLITDGITIKHDVTIWGNGHTLDGSNASRIFNVKDCTVSFHDIIFKNAKTNADGSAINGRSIAENCIFTGNTAGYGGATYATDCINCIFIENTARYMGGAGCGGSFENCIFIGNSAHHSGGAIYIGSNTRKYTIANCRFTGNHANEGGAINIQFSDYVAVVDCLFTKNTATWQGGATYNVNCKNCTFVENGADYGGAMKYGSAKNCEFTANNANFGGASYKATATDCTFIENYADYGGAIYEGLKTENCRFIGNYAFYGGAMYGHQYFLPNNCYFVYNSARMGGATYNVKVENSFFGYNEATEYGGAMYGEGASNCTFKGNTANLTGNDTYNTEISNSGKTHTSSIIYFDANTQSDGDGSKSNPYKYLYADRLAPGVTAYFADGIYELNSTCTIIDGVKLIRNGVDIKINSKISDQYSFIIKESSYLELNGLTLNNIHILNQGTLKANNCFFDEIEAFDLRNLPEIESGSGLIDSSYGGVIICDTPKSNKNTLIMDGCTFQNSYNAFNGGVIAAINSDISISNTRFIQFSSTYKGGAIYCENSNLNIYNGQFTPFTNDNGEDFTSNQYNTYTAYYGGSIYCENSNIFIDRSNFNGSLSFSFGGCIASMNSNITVRESNFNNSVSMTDGGGAIYNSKSELYIFNSKFNTNTAEFGGAICNINSILNSYRSTYYNNRANYYGGVIYDIYGTMNYYRNQFYVSHALAGGSIYTRIPNNFTMIDNTFGDSFAKEGSSIFYDGKKQNSISNYYANDYHVFAEFRATLNGKDYHIISNPLFYTMASEVGTDLHFPYPVYEVYDNLVTMMIYGTDEEKRLTSINNIHKINNISVDISFSDKLINPQLNVYLLEDLDISLYNQGLAGNLYTGPRDALFNGYQVIGNYSLDICGNSENGNYNFTKNLTMDFGDTFLSIKYDNLYEAASFNPVSMVNGSIAYPESLPSQIEILSSYYNSNDYGYVSSVKDQKNGGNCWAFSGMATLEACLSKATGVRYEFSVENAKNLMAAYSVYGIKIETNYAGYESMLLSYLTSWLGPIEESKENYDDYSVISILENPLFHIQNVKFLPARSNSRDNTLYKLAIRDNGAVSVTFKWGNDYHSVSLVGWDDNYVGYDSLGKPANGAWIFKNSWGPDWENNGFGYLSYDEKISEQIYPNLHAYTFIFSDNNPYTKIYQYDFAGVSEFYHYMDTISFKNTFTADSDALLSAFSTYFDRQTNFTVTVYKNDEFVFEQNGTSSAGYSTIPFHTFIKLDKGDKFTIAVNNHNKGYNCIPVCSAEEISKKTFSQNVSFISLDGENWFDLYDYAGSCNVACIKAFTQNINSTDIKISMDEFDSANTKNINIKTYFDGMDVDKFNYRLMRFIIDGNVYYAQIRNGVSNLNVKLDEGKHSLFAQYSDNVFESNIIRFNFTVKYDKAGTSFNALQDLINDADEKSTVSLERDYFYDGKFDDGEYGIIISKPMTINGNGHTINGLSNATGFYVAADNVILNNITVINASSVNGGGIYIAARNVTLNNCSFINSKASQNGGGLYSLFDITLNDCRFINNTANNGGGLYLITRSSTSIKNSLFKSNDAEVHGSAMYIEGSGTGLISSSKFYGNTAKYNGGAVLSTNYRNNFTDSEFENNSAISGGAVFSNSKYVDFNRCGFSQNIAEKSGGAVTAHNKINVYDSDFKSNYVIKLVQSLTGTDGGGAIYSFDELNIHDSDFTNNNAGYGGAIHISKYLKIYKSTFANNSASYSGGAIYVSDLFEYAPNWYIGVYSEALIYDSLFESNRADAAGAITNAKLVDNCTFKDNHATNAGSLYFVKTVANSKFISNSASYVGGAIYNSDNVYNSVFISNSAEHGGAIINFKNINITSSLFRDNYAETSGGSVYIEGESVIMNSSFVGNLAKIGGAFYLTKNGRYTISNSNFINNSAIVGGAIVSYTDTEKNMAYVSVFNSKFTGNNADETGGAICFMGFGYISLSYFANNSQNTGSDIYSLGHLHIRDSNISSNSNVIPIEFAYHYTDGNPVYGNLYMKNNRIDAENVAIYYNENEIRYNMPLYMTFTSSKLVKGQNITVARLEDENGNSVYAYGMGDLKITLTDQNANKVMFTIPYDINLGGYPLQTSSLNYGIYKISGKLSNDHPTRSIAKPGVLEITDSHGRTAPTIVSSGLIKTYGTKNKLMIALKDKNGKVLANCILKVKLNGRIFTLTTNRNGQASLAINLMPKSYIAVIAFAANSQYKSSVKTVKVIVKKATPKITSYKKTFRINMKVKKYAVILKNNMGKVMKNTWVKMAINGKIYAAKTNAKGQAIFKITKLAKKGKFIGTIGFSGNKYYNKAIRKVIITVIK